MAAQVQLLEREIEELVEENTPSIHTSLLQFRE
jgi:hypothetical protein